VAQRRRERGEGEVGVDGLARRGHGDLHQVGQVHVHGAEQALADRAGVRARRGDRLAQAVERRTLHGVAVEVLFDERRFGLGVPPQLPVLAEEGARKIAVGGRAGRERDFQKRQAVQERRAAGGARLALVEPQRQPLLLAEHLAEVEVGELRVEIVDDRQPAEFGGHLADACADAGASRAARSLRPSSCGSPLQQQVTRASSMSSAWCGCGRGAAPASRRGA